MRTLCVLTNYKRIMNLAQIVPAWRPQVDRLVVVDNAPFDEMGTSEPESYPESVFNECDDVWRWTRNSGPPCRWAPALIDFDFDYVIFSDDDLVPEPTATAKLLEHAKMLSFRGWATIGPEGRDFIVGAPPRYKYGSSPGPTCSVTVQMHLVRRENVIDALLYREKLLKMFPDDAKLLAVHDDLMLCFAAQRATGRMSYTCGRSGVVAREIRDTLGVHQRPNHIAERNRFLEMDYALHRAG